VTSDALGIQVERRIYLIRGEKVMLDYLAWLYDVEIKALNKAVKRNKDRFPNDFVFQLTADEMRRLRCQVGTSSAKSPGAKRQIGFHAHE
jgi:hypothetical protein